MDKECPICCEEFPLLVVTTCCVQKICAQCKLKCELKCPFCRTVTVHIQIIKEEEEEVPVVSLFNTRIFSFCMIVMIVWIIRFIYILIMSSLK